MKAGRKAIEMKGLEFGHLTVIARAASRGEAYWFCRCRCGKLTRVRGSHLRRGSTRSCGCQQNAARHGHASGGKVSSTYVCWQNMLARCKPDGPEADLYAGRGITVCERWRRFENFLDDMGEKPPALSLDRTDNDGNYEPGNCRWATASEQMRNRRKVGELEARIRELEADLEDARAAR